MRWSTGLVCAVLFWTAGSALANFPKKRGSDFEEGKKIWKRSCWQCHGLQADGQGPAAPAISGGVPTLRDGAVNPENRRDQIDSILNGKGWMPSFSAEIERPDARRILVYLQKFDEQGGKDGDEEEEEAVEEEAEAIPEPTPTEQATPNP